MSESYVSRRDRIISSAIELISEVGLCAFNTRNLAARENISEETLYKYFGGIEEVLVAVVDYYMQFDARIRQTVCSKQQSNIDKILAYFEAYATYYGNYYAISTLMLQYEELLHKSETREMIANCIVERVNFLQDLFQKAIDAGEISDVLTPWQLANNVTGMAMAHILARRIKKQKFSFKDGYMDNIRRYLSLVTLKDDNK